MSGCQILVLYWTSIELKHTHSLVYTALCLCLSPRTVYLLESALTHDRPSTLLSCRPLFLTNAIICPDVLAVHRGTPAPLPHTHARRPRLSDPYAHRSRSSPGVEVVTALLAGVPAAACELPRLSGVPAAVEELVAARLAGVGVAPRLLQRQRRLQRLRRQRRGQRQRCAGRSLRRLRRRRRPARAEPLSAPPPWRLDWRLLPGDLRRLRARRLRAHRGRVTRLVARLVGQDVKVRVELNWRCAPQRLPRPARS